MTFLAQAEPSLLTNVVYPLIPWVVVFAFVYLMLFVVLSRVIKRQRENTNKLEEALKKLESQLARIADAVERGSKGG